LLEEHQDAAPGSVASDHGGRRRKAGRYARFNRVAAHKLLWRARHLKTTARLVQQARSLRAGVEVRTRLDMIELGSTGYGSWSVPETMLGQDSVCYLAGTGTDITFDLALIARFGCTVHAFDPVPSALEFVARAARHEPRFVFHPVGLWSTDTTLSFHEPVVRGYISHSATDIHHTPVAFEGAVQSVRSVMREQHHDHVDLLKISAEGAEYEILAGLEQDGIRPRILSIEFAQPAPTGAAKDAYDRLVQAGYDLVASRISVWTCKMTFVRTEAS
jgi:FkbM family methyltransferase